MAGGQATHAAAAVFMFRRLLWQLRRTVTSSWYQGLLRAPALVWHLCYRPAYFGNNTTAPRGAPRGDVNTIVLGISPANPDQLCIA